MVTSVLWSVCLSVLKWLNELRRLLCVDFAGPKKGKGSPYSITEHEVPELVPVLGSQPAGAVSHKPCGRLPLFLARPTVTLATLKRTATSFTAW